MKSDVYSKGFSLIELMVSITLLILILGLGSMAYSQYRDYWLVKVGSFDEDFSRAKGVAKLLYSIKNVQPFIIKNEKDEAFHYFEGAETLIRSVTSASVKNKNKIAAFEIYLQVAPDGTKQLFYREQIFSDSVLIYQQDIGEYGKPQLLLEGFSNIRFEYFGFKHVHDWFTANDSIFGGEKQWFGAYSGADTLIIPELVRIRLTNDDRLSELVVPLRRFSQDQYEFYSNEVD